MTLLASLHGLKELRIGFIALGTALLVASLAAGVELKVSADTASISCREGKVFVWIVNDASEERLVAFSAQFFNRIGLNGFFEDEFLVAPAHGAKGTYLHFRAPDNMRGAEDASIRAQITSPRDNTVNEFRQKNLRVFVTPCASKGYYINGTAKTPYYEPPRETGEGTQVKSYLTLASYFDPTEYDVDFLGATEGKKISAGGFARFKIALVNRGAAGTFDLKLVGDKDAVNAVLSNNYVSLSRGGIQEFYVDVQPSRNAGAGRYWITVQAIRNFVVLAEKDVYVDVEDKFDAELALPQSIKTSACSSTAFTARLKNVGSREDSFILEASEFASLAPTELSIPAGKEALFTVTVDGSKAGVGARALVVRAESLNSPERKTFEKTVAVQSSACVGEENVLVEKSEQNEVVKLFVEVENPFDSPLEDATISISGLPKDWSYSAPPATIVPANSKKTILVSITRGSDEGVKNAVIEVRSKGRVVAVKEFSVEPRATGLTGFVTLALSQNTWLIALIILIALLVVVLAGRRRFYRESQQDEEYKQRLENMRKTIEK